MAQSLQYMTLSAAKAFIESALTSKGIQTSAFEVELEAGMDAEVISVQGWTDDGKSHLFYVTLPGGQRQIVGLAKAMIGAGGFDGYQHFFVSCFGSQVRALDAIVNIPAVTEAINSVTRVG